MVYVKRLTFTNLNINLITVDKHTFKYLKFMKKYLF